MPNVKGLLRRNIIKLRMEDVKEITIAYNEMSFKGGTNINYSTIITALQQKGIKLNNPIPIDKTKPCYEVVYPQSVVIRGKTNIIVVIENENAASIPKVRSYDTGLITIE